MLVAANIFLSIEVVGEIRMDIQMIRLNHQHYRNMRRLFQIPQLKAGQFVNNNVGFFNLRQDIQRWHADVADQVYRLTSLLQDSRNQTTRRSLALRPCYANNRRWTLVEKLVSRRSLDRKSVV